MQRFPVEFSRMNLPREKCEFVFRVETGEAWVMNYNPSVNGRYGLSKGWSKFVRENSLQEDDFCVFELVKLMEFQVHIFSPQKEGYFDNEESSDDDSNQEDDEDEEIIEEAPKSKGKRATKLSKKVQRVTKRRKVTEEEIFKVQKAAHSFTSRNPFFVVRLMPSHFSNSSMRFPMEFSRVNLPRRKCEFVLRVENGNNAWVLNYNPSANDRDALGGGWSDFVRENGLEVDDFCAFELVKPTTFQVHIFRVVELAMENLNG